MKAVVIGAGIGGLAAAIALRQAGIEPVVFEQAERLDPVGGGLTLAPNAMRALERLGLADDVRAEGERARRIRVPTWRGKVVMELDLERHGWEGVGVHRADLQRVLLARLPDGVVHLRRRCVGVHDDGDGVRAEFADGSEETGDLLVGADGIHSVVRAALFGPGRLRYADHAAWRAVVQFEDERVSGTWAETWGPRARVGIVPIGGGRIYLYVAEDVPENAPAPPDPEAEFRRRFADWHAPIPAALAAAPPHAFARTFTYDRAPLRAWGRGRITLLGDAAHAMRPDIGQGAAVALEDTVILRNVLSGATAAAAALRAYEACRRRRAASVVRASRQAGSFAQASSATTARLRDAFFSAVPARIKQAQYVRQITWDPDCGRRRATMAP